MGKQLAGAVIEKPWRTGAGKVTWESLYEGLVSIPNLKIWLMYIFLLYYYLVA